MKKYRKVFFYFTLFLGIILIAAMSSVFLFKERIINQFINEANKNINTPVKIRKIDISWFEDFPNLSIVFHDVYIEDSHPGQYPLLTAEVMSFQLHPMDVYNGKYHIKGLQIRNSETNLKISSEGKNNYTIVKDTQQGGTKSGVTFQLKNVKLKDARVRYLDLRANQEYDFATSTLSASIYTANDIYDINAEGQLKTQKIKVDQTELFNGKTFTIKSELVYDDINKMLTIKPSELRLNNSSFVINGDYRWKDKNIINLEGEGNDADIQTLISLMPEHVSKDLEKYQSDGDMYFKAKIKGEVSKATSPSLSVEFGFQDATLFHPEYKTRIEHANLAGSFASAHVADKRHATLVLRDINGTLNNKTFTANLIVSNFEDSDISLNFKGELDAASIFDFYPIEELKNITGSLMADIAFEGRLALLKNKATARRTSTRGAIELYNIGFSYGKEQIAVKDLKGTLQFNNNDLALSNVSARLGNSDFLFNGFFKNVITFLLFDDQPIGIETDLKADFLDLDQLFALSFGKEQSGNEPHEYEFNISRNLHLNFNCDVKSLRYKRFHASQVKGDLLVKNEVAVSRNINLRAMGGEMSFSGIVDNKNKKVVDVVNTFKLNGIHIDSIFYVFENFNQTFIEDKHLKGQAYADVNLEMSFNENLKLFSETLIADIGLIIKHGELNNFEPMKKLDKYLDDRGLDKVRFSDIKNDIHIENKKIFIPQMDVKTNVTNIRISGAHTFDQNIDYRIVAPLRSYKKISFREAEGAIENDASGSKLFLKIVGTTDNYRVVYDTEAVRKKIANDIKNEVQELKDAFKNKGKKKQKELELQEDEYFDWEE